MKNNETKELKTSNGMYLLKMEEMFSIRGGITVIDLLTWKPKTRFWNRPKTGKHEKN